MLQLLYGGAIQTVIPESEEYDVVDVSKMRQIPDSQEVFILEGGQFDRAIIFDILEMVDGGYEDAIKVHISDLIELDKPAQNTVIETLNNMTLSFIIHDSTRKDSTHGSIVTLMNLVRLDRVDADILISMNIPLPETMQLDQVQQCLSNQNHDLGKDYLVFKIIAENFKILDWKLFG